MVRCYGCGFRVEQEDVRDWGTVLDANGLAEAERKIVSLEEDNQRLLMR
jgi:hypothetical protein